MLWRQLLGRFVPGPQDPVREASEQRHNKSAKIQTALEATMVNSLHQIDKDERAVANAYRNWKVFGDKQVPKVGGGSDEEMLIADNIYNIKPPSLLGPLLGIAGIIAASGGAGWLLLPQLANLLQDPEPAAVAPEDAPSPDVIRESDVYDYTVDSHVIEPDEQP